MTQCRISPTSRLLIEPFRAVYVDKCVICSVVDNSFLVPFARSIDIFAVVRTEFEMNET